MMRAAPRKLHPDGEVPQTMRSRMSAKTSWVYCFGIVSSASLALRQRTEGVVHTCKEGDTYDQIGGSSSLLSLKTFRQEELKQESRDTDSDKQAPIQVRWSAGHSLNGEVAGGVSYHWAAVWGIWKLSSGCTSRMTNEPIVAMAAK